MKLLFPTREKPWGSLQKGVGNLIDNRSNSLVNYVEFNITGRCKGGCITCPTIEKYDDEKTRKTVDDLTEELERFKEMLRKLKDLGMSVLSLYGREPTLWDKESKKLMREKNYFLKDLIEWLSRDLSVRVCLLSSGLDLDESLLRTLFDNRGILFMKNWGSEKSFSKLMKHKNAYKKNKDSWNLVREVRKDYDKTRVLAEFLYTGINRGDLLDFWRSCITDDILPFVEVPTMRGACIDSYESLKINKEDYVRDIYELSLLNISLLYRISLEEVKNCEFWYPPYGSVFPMPCDKLTKAKSLFIERNGDLTICSGVPVRIGNINDEDIGEKLRYSQILVKVRALHQNLEGDCSQCIYSRDLNVCYGCRGNAYTYTNEKNIFKEDPMCFGKAALNLGEEKLSKFMSEKHLKRLKQSFKEISK
jgi:MoaA/NifB/PqqE/SkfB family radical SAM enzyme